jgi:rfaE bifunctional protein kinase chain/domain
MVTFTEARLRELFENFKRKRIAVVGDLMLDRYFWGSVARISPEAPVPVVEIESESARLGGAANVAHNIKSLGGDPVLIGVIGNDNSGSMLRDLLVENSFSTAGLVVDETRQTTVKTRVIAHHQHVVRIDRETREEISYTLQHRILEILHHNVHTLDAIVIEDYNKGVIVKSLIKQIVGLANEHKRIIVVDPKFNNFFDYQGVTVFKPNRKEVEEVMGIKLLDDATVEETGKALMARLQAKCVLLTRGERGMTLFEESGIVTHVPTKARKVADVSGAGDTVTSTLAVALAGGATMREAATLANYAGGVVCEEVGVIPIVREALFDAVVTDSLQ